MFKIRTYNCLSMQNGELGKECRICSHALGILLLKGRATFIVTVDTHVLNRNTSLSLIVKPAVISI